MQDIRQTPDYAAYMESIGWVVERKESVSYFIKKFPLIGSFIKIQRPEKLDFACIYELIHEYRAFQVVIEPINNNKERIIKKKGFRISKSPYLPTKTLHLDLIQFKNKLLKQMVKDARYSIRKTKKLTTKEVKSGKDIDSFRNSWKKSVGPKRYVPSLEHLLVLKKIFGEKALFLSTKESSAGAIFLIGDKTAYYWQAFTSKRGRKSLSQYRFVWEGILWAKGNGAKVFDFEGIYDERFPNKSWLGFTKFKKKFGGKEVEYPGAFIKFRFPF